MIKKNKDIDIPQDNIFLNDKLNRKDEIENLSSLIVPTKSALTMSINADWGAGKTTFVKLWREYLKKEYEIQSIYFSAWENDFSKEPLITMLGEINKYIEDNFKEKKEVTENFKKIKEIGVKIVKRALPAFVKGATSGLLDIDEGFENAISSISEQVTNELIENYSKDKELTEQFKETIQELLNLIGKDKPFVIFIDELDRCRPLYAIELLERIKHIFGVDGLIFVLSIDKKQLLESIKSQYGNIDAASYLKRFIELEYNLRNIGKDEFCTYLYKYYRIDEIIKAKDIENNYPNDLNHLAIFKYLAKSFDLTLREIEQAFMKMDIVFKTIQPRLFESHFRVFVFLILLKIKREDLYFGLIKKTIPHKEILEKILPKKSDNSTRYIEAAIKSIVYATSTTYEELQKIINQETKKLDSISDKSSKEYDNQKILVTLLKHDYGKGVGYGLNSLINTAIKKIEFADKFNFDGIKSFINSKD